MAGMSGLLVALGIGLPLLGTALWLDWRRTRNREGPRASGDGPSYIRDSEIEAMPRVPASHPPEGMRVSARPAHSEFTDAVVDRPFVMVIDGEVSDMREVMIPIARYQPLVILATSFTETLAATLAANRRALRLGIIAVTADDPGEVAALVGAELVIPEDLKAGYLPETHLGSVARWACDGHGSMVMIAQ